MRVLFAATVMVASAVLVVGCTPAANKKGADGAKIEYEVYPTEVIILKPGEQKEAKVSRKGKDLKDTDLTVTSSDPSVTVEGGKFKGDSKDATITIKVAPDAAGKEHTVTIKSGDTTKTLKVRVEPAGGAAVTPKTPEKTDEKTDEKNKKDVK